MISVIIPTHNREAGLIRAIRSVYSQTKLPNELIVIDDGSKTAVTTKIFSDAPKHLVCTLLRNDTPMGANHSRNRGIRAASSDWIAFLDDDDEFVPKKLEIVASKIERSGDVLDVISHSAKIVMPDLNLAYLANIGFPDDLNLRCELLIRNVVGSTSFATVKRKSLISAGLFWCDLPALQDNELWLRLALADAKFVYINKPLTIYDQSMSNASITKSDSNYLIAYKLIDERYQELYDDLCRRDLRRVKLYRLRSRVHRALLNNNIKVAFFTQLRVILNQPSLKNLLLALLCLAGSHAVYKVRSSIERLKT